MMDYISRLQKKINRILNNSNNKKNLDVIPLNWHEDFVISMALVLQPKIYVELGVFQCALFNRLIPYAD